MKKELEAAEGKARGINERLQVRSNKSREKKPLKTSFIPQLSPQSFNPSLRKT